MENEINKLNEMKQYIYIMAVSAQVDEFVIKCS